MNKTFYTLPNCWEVLANQSFDRFSTPIEMLVLASSNLVFGDNDSLVISKFPNVFKMSDDDTPVLILKNDSIGAIINEVIANHYQDFVFALEYQGTTPNSDVLEEMCKDTIYRFLNKVDTSTPRYVSLLKLYKDNENNLLARVKSVTTGVSRFNDTPQGSGEFDDDKHTTNISENSGEVATDVTTIMARIKEVQESYRNLLQDWAKEFESMFLYRINVEDDVL